MLKCVLKNIQKYVINIYFQIVFLVSKLISSYFEVVVTRGLKSIYVFFTH